MKKVIKVVGEVCAAVMVGAGVWTAGALVYEACLTDPALAGRLIGIGWRLIGAGLALTLAAATLCVIAACFAPRGFEDGSTHAIAGAGDDSGHVRAGDTPPPGPGATRGALYEG